MIRGEDRPPLESRPLLSLVIPAYNEEGTVQGTVETVKENVDDVCNSYEIILVDDGSGDDTASKLRALSADNRSVRYVENEENHGKGYAVREGCLVASGENIMLMDADGDLSGDRIETFLRRLQETDADIVIGSKRHPDSSVAYPIKRRILSRGYSLLIRLLFGLRLTDTQVGLKLLRREVAEDVMPLLLVERYAFDVELLALAHKFDYTIAEAPVSLKFNGHSSIDWKAVVRIGWDTLAVFVRLNLLQSYETMNRAVQYARERALGGSLGGGDQS